MRQGNKYWRIVGIISDQKVPLLTQNPLKVFSNIPQKSFLSEKLLKKPKKKPAKASKSAYAKGRSASDERATHVGKIFCSICFALFILVQLEN